MKKYFISALVLLLFLAGAYFYVLNAKKSLAPIESLSKETGAAPEEKPAEIASSSLEVVKINSLEIPVELAITDAQRQQGLSGRASLPENNGMLFIFDKPAIYHFWMPDMNFPIDIIWINDNKVLGINENASNEFDPENPVYYTPPTPAQYVLEVNAGFASKKGIKTGDSVILP